MSEQPKFKNVIVKGGWTGKKLHVASSGSSATRCGHWFKVHVMRFYVADVNEENIRALKTQGKQLCEKCFRYLPGS